MDFFSTVCFGFAERVQMTVHSWQLSPEQQHLPAHDHRASRMVVTSDTDLVTVLSSAHGRQRRSEPPGSDQRDDPVR